MNRVYVFSARLSPDAERICQLEINRGRALYNAMVAQYNPHPRQRALSVVARHKLAEGDCYTGTYFAAVDDFQRMASAKRVGVWPGDPYRFRSWRSNAGAMVGAVFMKSVGFTWQKATTGRSSLFAVDADGSKYSRVQLKVSRNDEPIEFTAHIRREIPPNAIVTKAYLARIGDYGTRHKWELRVTFDDPSAIMPASDERIGVDVGWHLRDDGSLLVARTSDCRSLEIPPYIVRMKRKESRVQSWRQAIANRIKARYPACEAKSANGVAAWCEEHRPESESDFIRIDRALHCKEDHLRRRYISFRDTLYKTFASTLTGRAVTIKTKLKDAAESELSKNENWKRALASNFELVQCLRNSGALEVVCESRGDDTVPDPVNAEKIRKSLEDGKLLVRPARKAVRKYRKRLAST